MRVERTLSAELAALVERGNALVQAVEPLADPRLGLLEVDVPARMLRWSDDCLEFVERRMTDQGPIYRAGLPTLTEPLNSTVARNFIDTRLQKLRGYLERGRSDFTLDNILGVIADSATATQAASGRLESLNRVLVGLTIVIALLTLVLVAREFSWI